MSSLLSTLSVLFFEYVFGFYAILHVFVFYPHCGYNISNEKINGHQAFESLGLLGALTFHNSDNY